MVAPQMAIIYVLNNVTPSICLHTKHKRLGISSVVASFCFVWTNVGLPSHCLDQAGLSTLASARILDALSLNVLCALARDPWVVYTVVVVCTGVWLTCKPTDLRCAWKGIWLTYETYGAKRRREARRDAHVQETRQNLGRACASPHQVDG